MSLCGGGGEGGGGGGGGGEFEVGMQHIMHGLHRPCDRVVAWRQ